jgi:hypothetical protein
MHDASIKIIGRPDATVARGKLALIPENRAKNIKDYLTRQGIPAGSITIEIDNSPNPQESGIIYPSDIVITKADRRQVTASAYTQQQYTPPLQRQEPDAAAYVQPRPQQPAPKQAQQAEIAQREKLIQFINQSVQTGQMAPSVALQLMRALLTEANKELQQINAGVQQLPAQPTLLPPPPSAPTPNPVPAPLPMIIQKQDWVLDKSMTLRDNINAWSTIAGWNPSVWEAANFYQITVTSTVKGEFPDVLRQIADSTGLNICVNMSKKVVRITDAAVSCK